MREFLINMLVKQAGFDHVPKDQKEFFQMVSDNPQFQKDLSEVERLGIVKRGEDGTLNVINKDKVDGIVSNFIMKMLGGK